MKPNLRAILLALLVTFLWSTSFIIIKWGLVEIPPLTFAGLRYSIAFICLLPFVFSKPRLKEIKELDKKNWQQLILLGILFYAVTQGAQFVGLSLLPAVTVSLLLNFTPVIVAVLAIFIISEKPTLLQWVGVILFFSGILIYFYPVVFINKELIGLMVVALGVLANAFSAILGRSINRTGIIWPLTITIISMGTGSLILLVSGIALQGMPRLSSENIYYLLWLAAVNTAFAFTLWNFTLRSLTAMESSIINGTMLIQIAILAFIFLGEDITIKEIFGLVFASLGALLVQLKIKQGNYIHKLKEK